MFMKILLRIPLIVFEKIFNLDPNKIHIMFYLCNRNDKFWSISCDNTVWKGTLEVNFVFHNLSELIRNVQFHMWIQVFQFDPDF